MTAGYYDFGTSFHPYTNELNKLLSDKGNQVEIDNYGKSGERTESMVSRFQLLLCKKRYDLAIILGGTNDLGLCTDPEKIFSSLKSMFDFAILNQVVPVAVTVPENKAESSFDWIKNTRTTLNVLLKEYCEKEKIPVVDLAAKIPYHSLTKEEKKVLWDDGLHLTANGYDRFGAVVYDTIQEICNNFPKCNSS